MHTPFYRLMLVTEPEPGHISAWLSFVRTCATQGVTAVQLRVKNAPRGHRLFLATHLKAVLDPLDIPLIINDDLALAITVDAAGIHIGQTDGNPFKAREQLGCGKYLGLSIESLPELFKANACPLDYVAASAVFSTPTKTNLRTLWGLSGVRTLSQQSLHPVIGIGGIHAGNAAAVMANGAQGIALISALHQAANPAVTCRDLRALTDRGTLS